MATTTTIVITDEDQEYIDIIKAHLAKQQGEPITTVTAIRYAIRGLGMEPKSVRGRK